MEFVTSYEQLDELDLFVKLQFIEKHGFKFLCDSVDRKLRNAIAHLDVVVNEDGSILNTKTGEKIKDLWQKIVRLGSVSYITETALKESLLNHMVKQVSLLKKQHEELTRTS